MVAADVQALSPVELWYTDRGAGPSGIISASARDVVAFARMHAGLRTLARGG